MIFLQYIMLQFYDGYQFPSTKHCFLQNTFYDHKTVIYIRF